MKIYFVLFISLYICLNCFVEADDTDDCTSMVCPEPNQEYAQNVTLCQKSCANIGIMISCLDGNEEGLHCRCKEGFVREVAPRGACISICDCPLKETYHEGELDELTAKCCPEPNQEFAAGVTVCQPNCENPGAVYKCTTDTVPDLHCRCKEGFVRLEKPRGACVLPSECPKTKNP